MSVDYYSFQGITTLKGFIKNGLDSSTLINLIVAFDGKFEVFKKQGFTFPPHLFFYHEISRPEVIGVLINKHRFTKEEAVEALDNVIREFYLEKIQRNFQRDQFYQKIVADANATVVKKIGRSNLKIGEADLIIISGFLRENIMFIHSGDDGFLKTCEELKMKVISLPQQDREKEKEIKDWMKKRKD